MNSLVNLSLLSVPTQMIFICRNDAWVAFVVGNEVIKRKMKAGRRIVQSALSVFARKTDSCMANTPMYKIH